MKAIPLVLILLSLQSVFALGDLDLSPGLKVTEYPRHVSQVDREHTFVAPDLFGTPIGQAVIAESTDPWKHDSQRNALAEGYLKIDEDGDYAFNTISYDEWDLLMIDGQIAINEFVHAGNYVATVPLKKGWVKIASAGYFSGPGGSRGIQLRWKPPGQVELGPIPANRLFHSKQNSRVVRDEYGSEYDPSLVKPVTAQPARQAPAKVVADATLRAEWLTMVAKDFVVEIYHNGKRVPDAKRKMLEERFGSMVERVDLEVVQNDWLVFHVVNNRMRHGGTKFFAVAGHRDDQSYGFVTHPDSEEWSVCDEPSRVREFIANPEAGSETRAVAIAKPWEEGMGYMRQFGGKEFPGAPVWGTVPSTWIKFHAQPGAHGAVVDLRKGGADLGQAGARVKDQFGTEYDPSLLPAPAPAAKAPEPAPRLLESKRWRVQVLSAVYGTAGKDVDVLAKVRDLVEERPRFFAVNPVSLGADPNPGWNKGLRIVYMKDGVRREQRRNENEHVLPESFYGPQDTAELSAWLPGSRWMGVKGEVQFHAGGALTGPKMPPAATWEAIAADRLRITWSAELKTEYGFDYTWSSFSAPEDGQNSFRAKN